MLTQLIDKKASNRLSKLLTAKKKSGLANMTAQKGGLIPVPNCGCQVDEYETLSRVIGPTEFENGHQNCRPHPSKVRFSSDYSNMFQYFLAGRFKFYFLQ